MARLAAWLTDKPRRKRSGRKWSRLEGDTVKEGQLPAGEVVLSCSMRSKPRGATLEGRDRLRALAAAAARAAGANLTTYVADDRLPVKSAGERRALALTPAPAGPPCPRHRLGTPQLRLACSCGPRGDRGPVSRGLELRRDTSLPLGSCGSLYQHLGAFCGTPPHMHRARLCLRAGNVMGSCCVHS